MENEMEPIDFSELQNVKDIDKRRKVCPKCNGSGFVFLN
jgi:ribosomal protein S27AE